MGGCLVRSFQVGDAVELGPEEESPKVTKVPLAKMGKIRGKSGLGEEIQKLRHRDILKTEPIKRRRITNQGQARERGVPR